jgi:hypothetical protein
VAADTAKDNRKDNDKERRFALVERKTVTRIDEQGEEFEEELLPVEEVNGPAAAASTPSPLQKSSSSVLNTRPPPRAPSKMCWLRRLWKPCWPMQL